MRKSISETISALESALAKRKFSALWHLDTQAKWKEKGLELAPEFHLFEVCNAPRAKEALETNVSVGYFLPCKMVVFSKDGKTTFRPIFTSNATMKGRCRMSEQYQPAHTVDARNLSCPMPIVKARKAIDAVQPGHVVEILATDRGAMKDLESWAKTSGHDLLKAEDEGGTLRFHVRRKSE